MKIIGCIALSVAVFSPALVRSGYIAVTEGITKSQDSLTLIAAIATAALIGLLLKHVTNSGVHYDPKNPVVTEQAHKSNLDSLGRSIDEVRSTGKAVEKTVNAHSTQLAVIESKLDQAIENGSQ